MSHKDLIWQRGHSQRYINVVDKYQCHTCKTCWDSSTTDTKLLSKLKVTNKVIFSDYS